MACQCLEQCGRYLLRSPDSHLRAKALLEILVRKKSVLHLDGRQKSMVESALYYANPLETPPDHCRGRAHHSALYQEAFVQGPEQDEHREGEEVWPLFSGY